MRAMSAYFVGAGSIVAALAMGLGGGLVAGNILNPVSPKQGPDTSKWERRVQPEMASMTSSARVPYLAGSQAMAEVLGAPPPAEPKQASAQGANENAAPAVPERAAILDEASNETGAVDARAAETETESIKPAQQASTEPAAAPVNAYAKAGDAEVKRAITEPRRAERRSRWGERRRHEMREPRDRTDWDDVARNVRRDSQSRAWASGARSGFPQVRLFGDDD